MARDVESLALCLRALLCEDMFRLDPTVPPLPFREEVSKDGAGVGVAPRGMAKAAQISGYSTLGHQVELLAAFGNPQAF